MRNILYKVITTALLALLLLSWFLPWWQLDILPISCWVRIRPWALEDNLGTSASYIAGYEMPVWFAPLMWIYLGICVLLLILSLFVDKKRIKLGKVNLPSDQLLVGIVGISYIVVVILAVIVAAVRTGDFDGGVHLIGQSYFDLGHPIEGFVEARLLLGYWFACATGPLLIILGLLRNKITGRAA
jgi:hypothetical protein